MTFNGVTQQAATATQTVTVTFVGDGVVVGMPPGQTQPTWLSVTAPATSNSPVNVQVSAYQGIGAGNYSTTLRFVTGKADGSQVVFRDVPVTFNLAQGQQMMADVFGLATGSTVAASLNGGAPVNVVAGQQNVVGTAAVGSNYTATVPVQPTGQNCTFPNGAGSITATVPATFELLRINCNASLLPWTWVGGPAAATTPASHGTLGVAAASNTPGGREHALRARDAAGNLWIFGGGMAGYRNDLWRYDIGTGLWTWISGDTITNAAGVYGTLNTPAPGNKPGARAAGAMWFDDSGSLWLFGGEGFATTPGAVGFLNDLWKFDVTLGQWSWMGGSSSNLLALGTYGTTPSTANIPGARIEPTVMKDAGGNVWLFGGYGAGAINSYGRMNDLWKFAPATGVWSWISGASEPVQNRVQGTLGVPATTNFPSARAGAAGWIDTSGNIWIFGGTAWFQFENDLWRFNPLTLEWTWMGGTDRTLTTVAASRGTYLPPGTTNSNYPTSRGFAAAWTDAAGEFWMFGGYGEGPGNNNSGPINDLWKFSPATNTWSWLSGANAPGAEGVRGTQGVAAVTNVPAGRSGAVAWSDNTGRLWLWGGGYLAATQYTDVWRFTPP